VPRSSSRARSGSSRGRQSEGPPPPSGPSRILVYLRSLDHRVVDQAAVRLTDTAERAGGRGEGPIPLPSQPSDVEGMRTHVREVTLVDPDAKLLGSLQNFDLPTGVQIEMAG
jgi:small subunit ribosomal protein S10